MKTKCAIGVLMIFIALFLPKNSSSQTPIYVWAEMTSGTVESIQRSVAVDAGGNVYIYGVFFGTVDFDPGTGTANVTPVPYGCNVYIAKYDVNGNYLWIKNIPITASYGANSMTLDASGNICITGFYAGSNIDFNPGSGTANLSSVSGSNDIYIAKYDANGNYLWAKSIGSTGAEAGNEILTDASGNIFVTGSFNGTVDFDPGGSTANLTSAGSSDVFFAKYDANGNYLWAKEFGGSSTDDVRDISLDGSGNIFLTGYFYGTSDFDPGGSVANLTSSGNNDIWFAKYDANGNYLWAKEIGSTSYDIGTALAVDASGFVFITGTFNGTVDFDPGSGTVNYTAVAGGGSYFGKFDANGNYVWVKALPMNTSNLDIMLDPCSSLFIAGSHLSGGASSIDLDPGSGTAMVSVPGNLPPPYYNIFARYDLNGNYLWGDVFGRTCYCSVAGYKSSLACDINDYVYYAGIFNAGFFSTSTVDFDPGSGVANLIATSSVDNTFFAKYQCAAIALPIELISFYGKNSGGINHLYWSTASEINNDYFEIERSMDGETFVPIGKVNGHGNSDVQFNYSFNDLQPLEGNNYYCLKQIDFNGDFKFSSVISIENHFTNQSLTFGTLAPGVFEINYGDITPSLIKVYDASGRMIYSTSDLDINSSQNFVLDLRNFPNGIYLVAVMNENSYRAIRVLVSK